MRRLLRCYAQRHAGKWEAFCVDFDLAVQGDSFEEVYRSLGKAVGDYVERVHELPEEDQRRLLSRRAPLWSRLCFVVALLSSALRLRPNSNVGRFPPPFSSLSSRRWK